MHGFKKFLIAGAVQTAACLILLTLAIRYGRYGSTLIENYTLWKSFDTPLPILWAAVLLPQALTLLWFRNRPLRLKVISFWLVLATTQVARSLAIISAWNSDSKHKPIFQDPGNQAVLYMIPIFAMSPFHPIALDLGCWWTSFWEDPKRHHWRYRDFYYDYERTMAIGADGLVLQVFDKSETREYVPWRDYAIRSSHVFVFFNLFHVFWLRYMYSEGPYTTFPNNEELLNALIIAQLAVFGYARKKTMVPVNRDYLDIEMVAAKCGVKWVEKRCITCRGEGMIRHRCQWDSCSRTRCGYE